MYLKHKIFINTVTFIITYKYQIKEVDNKYSGFVSNFMYTVFIILQLAYLQRESRVSCRGNLGY